LSGSHSKFTILSYSIIAAGKSSEYGTKLVGKEQGSTIDKLEILTSKNFFRLPGPKV
jgi:hypothetical protein